MQPEPLNSIDLNQSTDDYCPICLDSVSDNSNIIIDKDVDQNNSLLNVNYDTFNYHDTLNSWNDKWLKIPDLRQSSIRFFCCGKMICIECGKKSPLRNCPFCRKLIPSDLKHYIPHLRNLVLLNNQNNQ
jgi:hypothetical protein